MSRAAAASLAALLGLLAGLPAGLPAMARAQAADPIEDPRPDEEPHPGGDEIPSARVFLELGECAESLLPHSAIAEALALERGVASVELVLVAQEAEWRIAYASEPCREGARHLRIEVRRGGEGRGLFERVELPEGSSPREQARAIALAMTELVGFAIERDREQRADAEQAPESDEGDEGDSTISADLPNFHADESQESEENSEESGVESEVEGASQDGLLERGGGFAALAGGRAYLSGALLVEVRIELPILLSREQTFVLRIDAGGGAGSVLAGEGGTLTFASAGLAVTYWLELPEEARLELGLRLEGAYGSAVRSGAGAAGGDDGAANIAAIVRGALRVLPLVHLDGRFELGARVIPLENETSSLFAPIYLALSGGISFP